MTLVTRRRAARIALLSPPLWLLLFLAVALLGVRSTTPRVEVRGQSEAFEDDGPACTVRLGLDDGYSPAARERVLRALAAECGR